MQLFPAIEGTLGTWRYYSTKMAAGDLANQVKFASEVWDSTALDYWIQRSLNESRAKRDIAAYLARHEDRFFNSIVVAAIEGEPKFFPVQIADDPQFAILADDRMNESFGVLRFDGTQKYYALDGQHRLRAIKALIENETEFKKPDNFEDDEFSVIIVVQEQGESREEFMKKYRRLFSHLNRYAKAMDPATTIIMEEDDAFAINTRRLIQEHDYFSWIEGESTRVRCQGGANIRKGESYFTTIISLYKMNKQLLFSKLRKAGTEWGEGSEKEKLDSLTKNLPDDDALDRLYTELSQYWDGILEEFPELREDGARMRSDAGLESDEEVDGAIVTNHMLFRPIVQEGVFAKLVRARLDKQEGRTSEGSMLTPRDIKDALSGLNKAPWRGFELPWRGLVYVYDPGKDSWRMRSEDRTDAITLALSMMRYIVGIDEFPSQDSLNEGLRKRWESLLIEVPEDQRDSLWDEIVDLASTFR